MTTVPLSHTPKIITKEILDACAKVKTGVKPLFIDKKPVPSARINKCVINVRDYVKDNPGVMILGWEISVWDRVFIDFIGHAIVKNNNTYKCITPSKYNEKRILFLPDSDLTFDFEDKNARMPHKQILLSKIPELLRLMEVKNKKNEILNQYPVTSGQIAITGEHAATLQKLNSEESFLTQKIFFLTSNDQTICLCGSGRKFFRCHKPLLMNNFAQQKNNYQI